MGRKGLVYKRMATNVERMTEIVNCHFSHHTNKCFSQESSIHAKPLHKRLLGTGYSTHFASDPKGPSMDKFLIAKGEKLPLQKTQTHYQLFNTIKGTKLHPSSLT